MDDLKRKIQFYCRDCGCRLKLCPGRYSLYYRCPKYEYQFREENEKVCMNRLSLMEAEKLYQNAEAMQLRHSLQNGACLSTGILEAYVERMEERQIIVKIWKYRRKNYCYFDNRRDEDERIITF